MVGEKEVDKQIDAFKLEKSRQITLFVCSAFLFYRERGVTRKRKMEFQI